MCSNHVKEFLEGPQPEIKPDAKRSSCDIVLRFGNQGTVKALHALTIPVGGMWLKIAVVKGATPLLVSSSLLRALGELVDTQHHELVIPMYPAKIKTQLFPKGLYFIDMNQLIAIAPVQESPASAAETYAPIQQLEDNQRCYCCNYIIKCLEPGLPGLL
jgi:hypothetical protein